MGGFNDDHRFDEAENEVDRGAPWKFREADAPNPLTIRASEWARGQTQFGEAEFMTGTDRDGKKWSVLVGGIVLTKRLIEGLVEAWSDEAQGHVVVRTEGRVQPGDVVSLKYLGDREGPNGPYPRFNVSRKPGDDATGDPAQPPPPDDYWDTPEGQAEAAKQKGETPAAKPSLQNATGTDADFGF